MYYEYIMYFDLHCTLYSVHDKKYVHGPEVESKMLTLLQEILRF